MSLITFSDVPRSILALLLDRVGEARGMSPRLIMGKPDKLSPQQIAELYAGGFIEVPDKPTLSLTPQFTRVARVILNPQTNLNIRIWGRDNICGETNIQFPRDIMQGGGVILNQLGRMYRISAFIDDSTVVKMMGDAIPEPIEQDLQFEFKAHLDNTVAAILFAVIDLARIRASKTKKPESALNMVIATQEVYNYMFDRWALTGFKDLISYITAVGMMPEAPSLTETVDGLRILVKAGLLKEIRTDSYGLSKAIEPLVRLTVGQPSGVQWQRISLMDNGEQIISNRMFLFADRSLMLCLAPTVKGRLFISRVRRKEITDFLADEIMATVTSAQPQAPAPRVAAAPRPVVIPPPIATPRPATTPPPPKAQRPAAPPLPVATRRPAVTPPPVAPPPPIATRHPAAPPRAAATPPPVVPPRPATPTRPAVTPPPVVPPRPATSTRPAVTPSPVVPPRPATPTRPVATPPPAVAPAAATAVHCINCGTELRPNAKFCPKCGATVGASKAAGTPVAATCPNCGQNLKPGAKFCSKCGAVIIGQTAAQRTVCPKCGRPLKPGAKFCTGCGTQL